MTDLYLVLLGAPLQRSRVLGPTRRVVMGLGSEGHRGGAAEFRGERAAAKVLSVLTCRLPDAALFAGPER
jgi:hypothetical protein